MLESGVTSDTKPMVEPKMPPYIFTERNGVHIIIDLVQTAQLLENTYEYMRISPLQKKAKSFFVEWVRSGAGL